MGKGGRFPDSQRDACIRKMVSLYFPEITVMVNGYGFDMLCAGPRDAVRHAVLRQNMGAARLIVGRDHAGVGDFYGPLDAQTIFGELVPDGALEIEISLVTSRPQRDTDRLDTNPIRRGLPGAFDLLAAARKADT